MEACKVDVPCIYLPKNTHPPTATPQVIGGRGQVVVKMCLGLLRGKGRKEVKKRKEVSVL